MLAENGKVKIKESKLLYQPKQNDTNQNELLW